jgi:PleD family two-component response regulator
MSKKILIAIKNDFYQKVYSQIFQEEGFEVLKTDNGNEAFYLAKKEIPDLILADVSLSEIGGFELMRLLKEEATTKRIPVMIFAQIESMEDKSQAMELEARDFIVGISVPSPEVVLRAKIILGEQKTYRIPIPKDLIEGKELAKDLGYSPTLTCPRCNSPLVLFLMRDLSKGKNYFKVSFICPRCGS